MEETLNIIAIELGLIGVPNKASLPGQDVGCLVGMGLSQNPPPEAPGALG
jgi:hypothetical protein